MKSVHFQVPKYQAHRGYHPKSPFIENTLESLIQARKVGFLGAEMDLQCTRYGEIILHHDQSLERIYKVHTSIYDLTNADIENFHITKLKDVLVSDKVPDFLNLEIKNTSFFNFYLEENLAKLIDSISFKKNILFSSFNPMSLLKMQHLLPDIPRALLVNFQKEIGNPFYLRKGLFEPLLDFQFLHAHYQGFDRSLLYHYNKRGIQVALWTINNKLEAERWLDAGVSSIITDEILPGG